jgi:hypothetical protein
VSRIKRGGKVQDCVAAAGGAELELLDGDTQNPELESQVVSPVQQPVPQTGSEEEHSAEQPGVPFVVIH